MSKTTKVVLGAIIAVTALIAIYLINTYNGFIILNETADKQWANVETQYQRRLDLIPNLANAVKGILRQEQEVFGKIAEARTRYAGAATVDEKVKAAQQMEMGLARLLVIVEQYPQLQSSANIRDLQAQIEGTENRISVERTRFNEDIRNYNIKVLSFPSNIVAKIFGFNERTLFEATEGAEKAPAVDLTL